jgi:DNA-binding NarL/FixJ family response regulator
VARIRVGLIDNNPVLALGIAVLIRAQPDMTFVDSARTAEALFSAGSEIDVIVVESSPRDRETVTARTRKVLARGIGVLVYNAAPDEVTDPPLSAPGAVEIVSSTASRGHVVRGIRAAQAHRAGAGPQPATTFGQRSRAQGPSLSRRELDVLELYAEGKTASHVASILGISTHTVLDHVKKVRSKYAAIGRHSPTKIDLYRRLIEDGLVQLRTTD